MADNDEYERLLREVEQFTAGSKGAPDASAAGKGVTPTPATAGADVVSKDAGQAGRLSWAGVAGVAGLVIGAIIGLLLGLLPFLGPIETGLGAAIGAAVAAFVSGPPEWFKARGGPGGK